MYGRIASLSHRSPGIVPIALVIGILPLVITATLVGPAFAGPNAGGTLILHATDIIATQPGGLCGVDPLDLCRHARVRVDDPTPLVWKIYAAFPGGSAPRLKGVTIGVDLPPDFIAILDYGACAEFELPDSHWPGPESGTALVFTETQTDVLVELYWFFGYSYGPEPSIFALIPHPVGGGYFGDDSVPSILDEIAGYGTLGFFTDGSLPCPGDLRGACCLESGACIFLEQESCEAQCGDFLGVGQSCDPNPCSGLPDGACCFSTGECSLVFGEYYCTCYGGEWFGAGTDCDPNPCGPTAVEESTWGSIKHRYRAAPADRP